MPTVPPDLTTRIRRWLSQRRRPIDREHVDWYLHSIGRADLSPLIRIEDDAQNPNRVVLSIATQ